MQNAEILGSLYENWDTDLFRDAMKKMDLSTAKTVGKMSRGELMKFQMAFAMITCAIITGAVAGRMKFGAIVLFIGISVGASIMVSQFFGAQKREDLAKAVGACITVTAD